MPATRKDTNKFAIVLPDGVRPGSLLTFMYEDGFPYHGILLSQQNLKGRPAITVAFIYPEDGTELTAIDLKTGKDSFGYTAKRVSICRVSTIRRMLEDEGYYAKGEPYTVSGGRFESNRRRH
jgi:hypothetical protein